MSEHHTLKDILASVGTTWLSGRGAIGRLPELLVKRAITHVFLIADEHTYAAAGEIVTEQLANADIKVSCYRFADEHLEPNESAVGLVTMHFDPRVDAVIGVGSGVINDISKIVANVSGKPYVIVATAPSMDGYASATSSMSVAGLKTSLPSKCADIIVGDTDVLRRAPMPMLLAGLGDMLAKYVALCDWRISTLINDEPFSPDVAALVRASLAACTENATALLQRDEKATEAVFEGLALCGVAMKLAGCSRPASGVEHYLSHVWDMRGEEFGTPVTLHGTQCAVGTYIAAQIYKRLCHVTPDRARALAHTRAFCYEQWAGKLTKFLGRGAQAMIALEKKEGKYDVARHAARLERILDRWDDLLAIIREEIPPVETLSALYDAVGLPKTMREIGLDEHLLPMSFMATKDIRDKYVLSRLCHDLGVTDELVQG